uniref:HNH nuclease domain-containing protein n=1 Tax=viral metagenome TaxID=1070528 RepID=A0A6M3LTS7_9ZZZZ
MSLNRRKFCECGCGTVIKRNRRFVHGHNSNPMKGKGKPKSPPQICACGICGLITNPGNRYVNGHYARVQITTEEKRRKLSIALTGKKHPPERIEKNRQARLGKKQSPETIEKRRVSCIGKMSCPEERRRKISVGNTGKKRTKEMNERNRQARLGKSPSLEAREKNGLKHKNRVFEEDSILKMSLARIKFYEEHPEKKMIGVKNPSYIDGRCSGSYKYTREWKERLKELVRDRDGRQCQLCFAFEKESSSKLAVHHIDYDKENCDLSNLISLCHSCHGKTSHDRDKWITIFQLSQRLTLVLGGKV